MNRIPNSYFNQETDRLRFRPLTKDDIPAWLEFLQQKDYLHFVGVDPTKNQTDLEIANEWIDRQLGRYEEDGFGMLAIIEKETGELIGMTGILSRDIEGRHEKEIGYSYLPRFWGKAMLQRLPGKCCPLDENMPLPTVLYRLYTQTIKLPCG